MAVQDDTPFTVYIPSATSPQHFGAVAVIVSAYADNRYLYGETFLLTEHGQRYHYIGLQIRRHSLSRGRTLDEHVVLVAGMDSAARHLNNQLRELAHSQRFAAIGH